MRTGEFNHADLSRTAHSRRARSVAPLDEQGELLAWFVGRKLRSRAAARRVQDGFQEGRAHRHLAPAGDQCPLQPLASLGGAQRTTHRWLSLGLDYLAFRELAARHELGVTQWLWSLARTPKVYDLFSWTDPAPFLQFWVRRVKRRIPR